MPYDQGPEEPITPDEAVAAVKAFVSERAAAGVMMADAFTEIELTDGVLTAIWNEDAIGKHKSDLLLEINPFEDLAEFIGTPLAFDDEEGRQIRQHVDRVSVIGPFGVGGLTARELYQRATGLGDDQI